MAEIAVVVPVLGRPGNARPVAESLAAATKVPYRLVFVATLGDGHQITECLAVANECYAAGLSAHVRIMRPSVHGDFARKLNDAYAFTDEPWIFQAADDVTFEPGWDVALLDCAERTGALVIGTQDGGNPSVKKGLHSTHTLISRAYCDDPGASMDGPGTVFSVAYGHQYTDTELVELAKARGVWAFCDEAKVTHHHPFWVGRDRMDDTYRKGLATSAEDARVYRQRSRLWAPGRVTA